MKLKKKSLLLLCSMFVLVLSLAIAACGSSTPTITFETNGGTAIAPIEAAAGTDITDRLPQEPTRDGYFFDGWYLEADCSGEAQELPTVMPENSVTYYAKWTEGNGAKLTLRTNDGGSLGKTSYNVAVGTDLLEFLADKAPTPKTGLTFAGWYKGEKKLTAESSDNFISAAGVTLTAKYTATYKVEVSRQNAEGDYTKDATAITGTAFYGEPFSCEQLIEDGTIQVPENLTLGPGGYFETDSLGVNETFDLRLDLKTFFVGYDPNTPDGEHVITDNMPMDIYVHGSTVTLGECGYVLSGHYRFLGWAATTDVTEKGDLLQPGATVQNDADLNLTYYAIWEKGYADVFDGGDVLYVDKFDNTKLYLEREGREFKEGTFDAAHHSFTFTFGDEELKGKLIEDEENAGVYTYFFYYREDYIKTYRDMENESDPNAATLQMFEDGRVEYRPHGANSEEGKQTGTYAINSNGYFIFEDADDPENNFLFNLFTAADGTENIVFRKQNKDEIGYYYDEDANIILYLDGLGGLRYYYHKTNAEYTGYDGSFTYVAIGYYEHQHREDGEEIYVAQTRDIASVLKQFTFKELGSKTATVNEADFPDLPAGVTVEHTVNMDDGVRGNYSSKWGESANLLDLTGYGTATFGETEGTYTLFTWLWSMEGENGDTIETYYLVRFTPNAENSDITYFRMDIGNREYIIDRTITADQASAYTGATGRFDLDIDPDNIDDWLFVLNMSFPRGFVMIYENGDAEVWTLYGTARPDETNRDIVYYVYYLEPALARTVTKDGDTYHFAQGDNTASGLNQFDFTLDASKKTAKVKLPDTHDIASVDTVDGQPLTLDYTTRTAKLGDLEVDYWYTIGYLDLYTFRLNGSLVYYWTDGTMSDPSAKHGDMQFHKIGAKSMYLAKITPELEETSYIGMLLFLDGTPEGDTYLAYMLDSGLYRVVGKGTTTLKNDKDYEFTRTAKLSDMANSEFEGYDNFTFRIDDENQVSGDDNILTYVFKHDELTYSNFTSDGYGTYTYTNGSASYEGTIEFTIGNETLTGNNGEGRLIYFHTLNRDFIFRVSEGSVVEVFDYYDSGDAGYWYFLDNNQNIRDSVYLVFDGNGTAFLYEYDYMTDTTEVTRGTYARTSRFVAGPYLQGGFMEYTITFEDEAPKTHLLDPAYSVVDTTTGYVETIPLYQELIPHRVGTFTVRGGGTIESIGYPGYPLATYTNELGETFMGNMYVGNVSKGADDHSFNNDADGAMVHFWALIQNGRSISEDYYFNIADDDELIPLTLAYGDYAFYVYGSVISNQVLRLDGVSSATIYSLNGPIENVLWSGTYEARGTSEYFFSGKGDDGYGNSEFTFRISSKTSGMDTVYVYEAMDPDANLVLVNDDWTVLVLNGYGDARYINKYGDVIIGTYTIFDAENGYGAFESDGKTDVFKMKDGNGYEFLHYDRDYAAAYYAADFSSVVLTGARFIIEGVEYFYIVSDDPAAEKSVTLYKQTMNEYDNYTVTFRKQEQTVTLPTKGNPYTYQEKQYLAYTAGEELTFTNDVYHDTITLKFTPDGATFAVAAKFESGSSSYSGYRVVVSYENVPQIEGGPVWTLMIKLTYLASGMDSQVEEYALTLTYSGAATGNTFTVEPHEVGNYVRYANKSAKEPMEGSDSVNITSGHIGALNLAPKGDGNALTITLGIKDSKGETLHYEGSLDAIRTEAEAEFTLGNVRAINLTSNDEKTYVLRFWIDDATIKADKPGGKDQQVKRFIIHSIVVEKTIPIDGIDITFTQLWDAGTHYLGVNQKDLVGLTAPQSSAEEQVIFMGALDGDTAAFVRNRFDHATETNVYEAYVYKIQKGMDGFIESATKEEKDYKYGEVNTSDAKYTLRFLYTGDEADFTVEYILRFSQEKYIDDATFEKAEGKNVWTIHSPSEGKTYTATITQTSGLGGLTLTEQQTSPAPEET